ncbi:DUF427 domain-containing protein [Halodurantibacterium flavum]|uniref:DUF427 domain-containing protein n=1 Tax=Halodurantibacterium flavum TaxID=1382802 RepID=A0ABW4SCG5_9RHOB
MTRDLVIRKAEGTWVVRAGGAVIAESVNGLEVIEAGLAPVIYFPREDVAMAFLDRSDSRTRCPRKGEASYFNLVAKSATIPDACWSYEDPLPGAERIGGYLSFYPDRVTVERV